MKRQEKLKTIKEKLNNQVMESTQPQGAPTIRQVPIWKSQETIEMLGFEWEVIYNTLANLQGAFAAIQSVMQRNIVSGKIDLDFEKLSNDGTSYLAMTDEEKAPHKAEFKATLDAIRTRQAEPQVKAEVQPSDPVGPSTPLS